MRILLYIIVGLVVSCQQEAKLHGATNNTSNKTNYVAKPLEILDFEGLQPLLKTNSDKIYVVNFWATWCAPCVKEMPYFEKLNSVYADQDVEVLLVSLDFPKKYESHLKPFILKNELKSKVVALNDADSNSWIPQIDPSWSGAIPATLIFNKDKRQFYEKPFTYEELEAELKLFLK